MINKVTLIGRLTRDPEIRTLSNGVCVASFTLAVDRTFKNKDGEKEADFIPVVVWRKTAELCEKFLSKGSMTAVVGRIQTRNYDAADGTKRYVTEVVADEVQFLSSSTRSETQYKPSAQADDNFGVPVDGFTELDDLNVPF